MAPPQTNGGKNYRVAGVTQLCLELASSNTAFRLQIIVSLPILLVLYVPTLTSSSMPEQLYYIDFEVHKHYILYYAAFVIIRIGCSRQSADNRMHRTIRL